MANRDVNINLIGNDRTGRATRSAAKNLDQLARKVDKFNGKNVKTKVNVDDAAVGNLKKTFAKAGDQSGAAFASSFRRKISSLTQRVRLKIRVNRDDTVLQGVGKRITQSLARSMSSVIADGSRAIGNAIRQMALRAPQVAGPAFVVLAVKVAGLLGQAFTAAFALALGPALLAGPIAFLLKGAATATKDLEKNTKKQEQLRKRLLKEEARGQRGGETKNAKKERLARITDLKKELGILERQQDKLEKQGAQWQRLKTAAKSFMQFISVPLQIPLVDAIDEVAAGLERLKVPVSGIMAALGPALAPFTKGVMGFFLEFIKGLEPALPGIVAGMQAWGQELPKIGRALGDMIAKIMANPEAVVQAVQTISSVLQQLASAAGTIISGLTTIGNAFDTFETKINGFEGDPTTFSGAFSGIGQGVVNALDQANAQIDAKLIELRGRVKAGIIALGRWLVSGGVAAAIRPGLLRIASWFAQAGRDAASAFVRDMSQVGADIARVWTRVMAFLASLPGRIRAFFSRVAAAMGTLPSSVGARLATLPFVIMRPFAVAAARAAGAARNLVIRVVAVLRGLGGRAAGAIAGFAGRVAGVVSGAASRAAGAARGIVNRVVAALRGLPGRARGAIAGMPGRVASVISSAAGRAASVARSLVSRVVGVLRALPGRARGAVASTPGRIASALSGAVGRARSIASRIVSGFVNVLRTLPSRAAAAVAGVAGAVSRALSRAVGAASRGISAVRNALHLSAGGSWSANAGDTGWSGSLSGGGTSRTGGPVPVNVAAPNVNTTVLLDGRVIETVARTVVLDENRRAAYKARVGRR